MDLETIERVFWENFRAISAIPRGSGNEKEIRLFLKNRAEKVGCQTFVDSCGNLIVHKEASKGFEDYPTLILQGHLDMVCEKMESSSHDFFKDPIELIPFQEAEERWIQANGTTLGADNGYALAVGLTLIDDKSLQSGALEFLFTVDEECGLTGACGVDASFLSGDFLINLDSEEENEFCIGCAGGKTLFLSTSFSQEEKSPLSEKEKKEGVVVDVTLSGFLGGHSGIDIDKKRGNALVELLRILQKVAKNRLRIKTMRVEGRHNVIPTKATATLFLSQKAIKKIFLSKKMVEKEPFAKLSIQKKDKIEEGCFLSKKRSFTVLKKVATLPYERIRFSKKAKGVETSFNPAILNVDEEGLSLEISFRSMIQKKLDQEVASIQSAFMRSHWTIREEGSYPPWEPQRQSAFIQAMQQEWRRFSGKEARLKVIHAGLECGVLKEKLPNCQMISLGPDIKGVHTPRERIKVDSANRVLFFLYQIVQKNFTKN